MTELLRVNRFAAIAGSALLLALALLISLAPALGQNSITDDEDPDKITAYFPSDAPRNYDCTVGATGSCHVSYSYLNLTRLEAFQLCGHESCVVRVETHS